MTKKIKSFRPKCLTLEALEHCYGEFWYNCETNDRMSQWGKCLSKHM